MLTSIISALFLAIGAASSAAAQDTVKFGDWTVLCGRPATRANCRIEQYVKGPDFDLMLATVTFNIKGEPEIGIRTPFWNKRVREIVLGPGTTDDAVLQADCREAHCHTPFRLNKGWIERLYSLTELPVLYRGRLGDVVKLRFTISGLKEAIAFVSAQNISAAGPWWDGRHIFTLLSSRVFLRNPPSFPKMNMYVSMPAGGGKPTPNATSGEI
ncbi:MAG: hypothetical protein JWM46_196 [Candidatus Kaiserbacteria bacterium]|nr:hypothetical protein [Candidatus Kaiserbacteria bacterium]